MKLFYQYMVIFFAFSPTSNHLHPLQVENCDSNSRLVVDEDDRLERVKALKYLTINFHNAEIFMYKQWRPKGFFQFKIIINVLVSSFRFI